MIDMRMDDGSAHYMGDDTFVLCQPSDQGPQSVVVTMSDLRKLLTLEA